MVISYKEASKDYTLKHRAMITLAIVSICWVLFGVSYKQYVHSVNVEVQQTKQVIGEGNTNHIVDTSKLMFSLANKYLPDADFSDKTEFDEKVVNAKGISWVIKQMQDLKPKAYLLLYQICFRLVLMKYWLVMLSPFLMAMIYEGMNLRKIKMYEFEGSSAVKQQMWLRTMGLVGFFSNLYLLLPFASGFGQYYSPLSLIALGYILRNAITHVTKTLGG